ncbi:glycosyltransferase family 4 protein [Clostridium sp. D2Q-14]|uniref:glycosyltransferase family 4 protein n=1 Tax=Anaeromonas gelatinilytica TaxID=2683194 RepID=UPI00193B1C6D|nr:glycosyltransferase family 4 protein [Anaeromonas gelatinilytica]MBS4536516.1 glycosyltransferase family 4 protein [Anaeromonas gelatinilytica]
MKVLLITQHFPPEIGAASNRMNNFAYYLNRKDIELTVLTNEPSYPKKELYKDNTWGKEDNGLNDIKILRVSNPFKDYSKNKIKRVGLYLNFMLKGILNVLRNKERFDAIIVTSPPIFAAVIGVILKKKYKSKLILDVRDLWPDSVKDLNIFKNEIILKPAYFFEKIMYKHGDKIIINSKGFIKPLKGKGIKDDKIVYIPNGIRKKDFTMNQKVFDKKHDMIEIIYAGTIGYAQGIDSIVEIANNLREYENISFKVIGTGVDFEKIKSLISDYNLNNIELMGVLSKECVFEELLKSDIGFIHLRDLKVFETVIPSKIFEYMLARLPIIAGVKGYISQMILDNHIGLLSNPYDAHDMSRNILELVNNASLRKEISDNQLSLLRSEFIWDENIERLIDLL